MISQSLNPSFLFSHPCHLYPSSFKSQDIETNLKEKVVLQEYKNIYEDDYIDMRGSIICDFPNENLNVWNGKIREVDNNEIEVIEFKHWVNCNTHDDYKLIKDYWSE